MKKILYGLYLGLSYLIYSERTLDQNKPLITHLLAGA